MSQKNLRSKNFLLILSGIVMGLILAAGFGLTGDIDARPPSPDEITAAGETDPDTDPDGSATSALTALGNAFADVAEKANPAVVTISTETTVKGRGGPPLTGSPFDEFFRRMYPQEGFKQQGLGSGVLMKSSGVILTNNHVIENADDIVVRLIDGREYKAEIKGTDPRTDLAVIQIDANESLPSLNIGNSDEVRVGQWVLAIGSPLGEQFAHTVTAGIVSAKGRTGVGLTDYEDFIQTDAAINPGNSGGALVNLKGELVGINTAIASRSGGNIGIGFAVPSNLVNKIMTDILEKGKVVRGWLGVGIGNLTPEVAEMYDLKSSDGVLIREVFTDGPAEEAGIEAGDIVVEISDRRVRNATELSTLIGSTEPGTTLKVTVIREGEKKNLRVTLGEYETGSAQLATTESRSVESLGMEVETLSNSLRGQYNLRGRDAGVVVTGIQPGSIASRAQLQEGDLIAKVNRIDVENVRQFNDVVGSLQPGDPVVFFIKRGDRKLVIDFVIPEN